MRSRPRAGCPGCAPQHRPVISAPKHSTTGRGPVPVVVRWTNRAPSRSLVGGIHSVATTAGILGVGEREAARGRVANFRWSAAGARPGMAAIFVCQTVPQSSHGPVLSLRPHVARGLQSHAPRFAHALPDPRRNRWFWSACVRSRLRRLHRRSPKRRRRCRKCRRVHRRDRPVNGW